MTKIHDPFIAYHKSKGSEVAPSTHLKWKASGSQCRPRKIILHPTKDIELLRRIRDSRFITSKQLFEYVKASEFGDSRTTFYWRIRRLVELGLLDMVMLQSGNYRIYTISRQGLRELENQQEYLMSLSSETKVINRHYEMPHALLLNDIRQVFEQQFPVKWWRTDLQVQAINLMENKYAKNYDAVFSVASASAGETSLTLALEYERTLKTKAKYAKISDSLSGENSVDILLYLCSCTEMVPIVAERIGPQNLLLCFTVARSFLQLGKQCPVFIWAQQKPQTIPLIDVINSLIGQSDECCSAPNAPPLSSG